MPVDMTYLGPDDRSFGWESRKSEYDWQRTHSAERIAAGSMAPNDFNVDENKNVIAKNAGMTRAEYDQFMSDQGPKPLASSEHMSASDTISETTTHEIANQYSSEYGAGTYSRYRASEYESTTVTKNATNISEANKSPKVDPTKFKAASDGSLVPVQGVGQQIPDTSSTTGINKGIAKKFSRRDRLNYGFTFEYVHGNERKHITLFVNPEEFTQAEPARINVTQTRGGAFVDHFGPGLNTISMRGVTGFRDRDLGGGQVMSGHDHFIALRELIRTWTKVSQVDPKITEMRFYNWADQEYYVVIITNFQLMRNVQRPLLYQYSMQMTVIQNLTEKVKQASKDNDASQYLINPEQRAPLAKNSLDKNTEYVNQIVSGTSSKVVDLSRLSSGTQEWSSKIAGGTTYFNQAEDVFKPISGVISNVEQFSKDVGMYVAGATSFITQPFDLVRDLANSIGDVISAFVSVANIPHELVRSFREMMCAIKALPETLFGGFTNPSLFEGASNCGTTLGIPEAPVSIYDNSFTATAQVSPQRDVSQIFNAPAQVLLLKETPSLVSGVYASTDVSRTGLNYLESVTDKQVTLTSVPNIPVVVDYSVPQPGTVDMVRMKAAGVWSVTADDTLEKIALDVYNDASEWKMIALFNNLEYPFIVDEDFEKERYATGIVRFYRRTTAPAFTGAITIPKYQAVYVPAYFGTYQIDFVTTEAKTLGLGMLYVDVPIVSTKSGDIGNVSPRTITGVTGYTIQIEKILNIYPTVGGKIWRVKCTGETLFIPQTETVSDLSVVIGANPSYQELFGVDIYINKDGEWEASTEESIDIKTVAGTKNLVQALTNRLATRKSFYSYHSNYGSNLPLYIGQKNDPKRQDLVRVDVKETCLLDPRIEELNSFRMVIDGDLIFIEFDAIPIEDNTPLKVNLIV